MGPTVSFPKTPLWLVPASDDKRFSARDELVEEALLLEWSMRLLEVNESLLLPERFSFKNETELGELLFWESPRQDFRDIFWEYLSVNIREKRQHALVNVQ